MKIRDARERREKFLKKKVSKGVVVDWAPLNCIHNTSEVY